MIVTAVVQYSILFLILLTLGLIFGAFDKMSPRSKKWYLLFSLGIFAFMTMFRDFSVGNDTLTYVTHFSEIASASNPFVRIAKVTTEPGFVIYAWLLSRITLDPRILFAVTGAIIYLCIGRFLNRYSEAPGYFVLVFFSLFAFNSYLSGVRQALSCAILLLAIDCILRGKRTKAMLLSLLAASFHYSAFIFLALWLIITLTKKDQIQGFLLKLAAISIAVMFGFQPFLNLLLQIFPKYNYYVGDSYFDGQVRVATVATLSLCLILVVVPLFFKKNSTLISENQNVEKFLSKMSWMAVFILAISFFANILSRLGNIAYLCVYALYSNNMCRLQKRDKYPITILMLVLFYIYGAIVIIYRTPDWQTTFPYKFGL